MIEQFSPQSEKRGLVLSSQSRQGKRPWEPRSAGLAQSGNADLQADTHSEGSPGQCCLAGVVRSDAAVPRNLPEDGLQTCAPLPRHCLG